MPTSRAKKRKSTYQLVPTTTLLVKSGKAGVEDAKNEGGVDGYEEASWSSPT